MAREYTIRDGTVISSTTGTMLVRLEKEQEDCGGCRSCSLKSLCHDRAFGHIDVPVVTDVVKQPGDQVRVAYYSANPAVAAFALFFPALVGLCGGGFAAQALAGQGDGIFVLGAVVGLAAGVAVTFVIGRYMKATEPEIRLVTI